MGYVEAGSYLVVQATEVDNQDNQENHNRNIASTLTMICPLRVYTQFCLSSVSLQPVTLILEPSVLESTYKQGPRLSSVADC